MKNKIISIFEILAFAGGLFIIFTRNFKIDLINVILFLGLFYSLYQILKAIFQKPKKI